MYTLEDILAAADRVVTDVDDTDAAATAKAAEYGLGPELPDQLAARFGDDQAADIFAAGLLAGLELARWSRPVA